jgi:hypothetical protein
MTDLKTFTIDNKSDQPITVNLPSEQSVIWTSLRDQIAIAALTGLISTVFGKTSITGDPCKDLSDSAYEFADAMLKAREVR